MSHRAFASDRFAKSVAIIAALTLAAAFATPASAMRNISLNADGDACTITLAGGGTVPGTEKGLECCATADPSNCVVILKPFPGGSYTRTSRHP